MWIHETNISLAILDVTARIKLVKIRSDEKHAIFADEWQNSLKLTVGFPNV